MEGREKKSQLKKKVKIGKQETKNFQTELIKQVERSAEKMKREWRSNLKESKLKTRKALQKRANCVIPL